MIRQQSFFPVDHQIIFVLQQDNKELYLHDHKSTLTVLQKLFQEPTLTTPDLVTFYEFYALKIDHSLYLNHFELFNLR